MKSITILFIFLFSFSNLIAQKEIEVTHNIEAVTVYLNSAEITRNAKVTIPRGKTELVFKGISSKILKQGIKVHISNEVKVYAINIEENKDEINVNKIWKTIEDKIQVLKSEKNNVEIELNILSKELLYLGSNMKIGGTNGATFAQINEGAIYFKEKVKKVQIKMYEQKKKLKIVLEKEEELKKEQSKIALQQKEINTNIRITVISNKKENSDIELKYLVSNAIWKPYYSIRTKGINEDITLEYQAKIFNDTGNDWINKPITLAILDASDDVSKPKMNTWVLNDDEYGRRDAGEGKLSKAKGNFYTREKQEVTYDVIKVDDLSTRFKIKDLHIIPSDATPHLIDIKTYIKKATYYTLSIPKIKEGAFIIARISDWENMGLLDGPIDLYFNNTFQGVSQLDTQQVAKELEIALGKDKSYTITRRKLKSRSREKLIGTSINETLTYEFIVKNNKNKNVKIELRDQLPVSIDKNVEVKSLEISGAKIDTQSGQLTWKLELKPLENRRIILKYNVKYPKKRRGMFKHDRKNLMSPRFF